MDEKWKILPEILLIIAFFAVYLYKESLPQGIVVLVLLSILISIRLYAKIIKKIK